MKFSEKCQENLNIHVYRENCLSKSCHGSACPWQRKANFLSKKKYCSLSWIPMREQKLFGLVCFSQVRLRRSTLMCTLLAIFCLKKLCWCAIVHIISSSPCFVFSFPASSDFTYPWSVADCHFRFLKETAVQDTSKPCWQWLPWPWSKGVVNILIPGQFCTLAVFLFMLFRKCYNLCLISSFYAFYVNSKAFLL